jgi:hypothetical protein
VRIKRKVLRKLLDTKDRDRKLFMEAIESHERAWGTETYKGRPTLEQLLAAKVVAFWHPAGPGFKPTVTIHRSIKDINDYATALVLHSDKNLPAVRLEKVFVNKTLLKIKGIEVIFERTNT